MRSVIAAVSVRRGVTRKVPWFYDVIYLNKDLELASLVLPNIKLGVCRDLMCWPLFVVVLVNLRSVNEKLFPIVLCHVPSTSILRGVRILSYCIKAVTCMLARVTLSCDQVGH